jgi:hypothetical protein
VSKLKFKDFLKRAEERGYAGTRQTWAKYERDGLVEFRVSNRGGWRMFRDIKEIDKIIDQYVKKIS